MRTSSLSWRIEESGIRLSSRPSTSCRCSSPSRQGRHAIPPDCAVGSHRAPSRMAEGHGAGFGALAQRASWVQAMFGLASHPSVVG